MGKARVTDWLHPMIVSTRRVTDGLYPMIVSTRRVAN